MTQEEFMDVRIKHSWFATSIDRPNTLEAWCGSSRWSTACRQSGAPTGWASSASPGPRASCGIRPPGVRAVNGQQDLPPAAMRLPQAGP